MKSKSFLKLVGSAVLGISVLGSGQANVTKWSTSKCQLSCTAKKCGADEKFLQECYANCKDSGNKLIQDPIKNCKSAGTKAGFRLEPKPIKKMTNPAEPEHKSSIPTKKEILANQQKEKESKKLPPVPVLKKEVVKEDIANKGKTEEPKNIPPVVKGPPPPPPLSMTEQKKVKVEKKTSDIKKPETADNRNDLLKSIRQGKQLKKVEDKPTQKTSNDCKAGDMRCIVNKKMEERRKILSGKDDDDDDNKHGRTFD